MSTIAGIFAATGPITFAAPESARTRLSSSSASTNNTMAVMTHSKKSWNQMMSSITGVAAACSPSCQGSG